MKKHTNLIAVEQQENGENKKKISHHSEPASDAMNELSALREPLRLVSGNYIKIDHATLFDNIAVIVGWATEKLSLEFPNVLAIESIPRPDASAAVRQATEGFIAVVSIQQAGPLINLLIKDGVTSQQLCVRYSSTEEELIRAMQHYTLFSGKLFEHFIRSRLFGGYLASACTELPSHLRSATMNAHLDMVRFFPNCGFIAYGWAFSRKECSIWLLTEKNEWYSMSEAMWFDRSDVTDSFAESFGSYSAESAFFYYVKNTTITSNSRVRIVVASDQGLFTVHEAHAIQGPQTPLGYARWAFSLSTPPSRFFERMELQDGALIDELITYERIGRPKDADVWETEGFPPRPEVSVIVPLYGRSDFVEYQLTKFSQDNDFRSGKVELIYVIDDPRLVEGLRQSSHQLTKLYKIPFRMVWGKINRGYSGANNLGLKYARGKTIILLNSDVFPLAPNWAAKMASTLQSDETIGAVGARLEYADGSVQHQGMAFDFAPEWKVWLNKHPGQGLAIPAPEKIFDVEAATGACLAVRRIDLEAISGMDENFLIGDFEDSDLCLKLRLLRGRNVVLGETKLVHLERQSFSQLGSNDFRTCIVKYNAWRHTRLWGDVIAAIKEKQQ